MLWSSQWPVKRSALMWFQFRPSVSLACRCHSETLSQLIGMRNRWSRSNGFNSKWNEARHIVQSHYLCPIWSSLLESLYSGRAHPPVLFSILICSQLLQLRMTENWERFLSLFSNWTRYRAWREPGRHLSTWFPSTLGLNMLKHILINIWYDNYW